MVRFISVIDCRNDGTFFDWVVRFGSTIKQWDICPGECLKTF